MTTARIEKYRATQQFWLGSNSESGSIRLLVGDIVDWDGFEATIVPTGVKATPEVDSFKAAIRKGWLKIVGRPVTDGWDDDPLEL